MRILAELVLLGVKLLSKVVGVHKLIMLFIIFSLCIHVHRFWIPEIVVILKLLRPRVAHLHQSIIGLVKLNLVGLSGLPVRVALSIHIVIITVIVILIHERILLQHIWVLVAALIHVKLLTN